MIKILSYTVLIILFSFSSVNTTFTDDSWTFQDNSLNEYFDNEGGGYQNNTNITKVTFTNTNTNNTVFKSEYFGDYTLKLDSVLFSRDSTNKCNPSTTFITSYSATGAFISEYWGELNAILCETDIDGNFKMMFENGDVIGDYSTVNKTNFNLDNIKPTFENLNKTILLQATDSYDFDVSEHENKGIDNYQKNIIEYVANSYSGSDIENIEKTLQESKWFTFTNPLFKIIPSNDSDGVNEGEIKMRIMDAAGNLSDTGSINIEIIAGEIDTSNSDISFSGSIDGQDYKEYSISLKDSNYNIIRPIANIRETVLSYDFDNTTEFLNGASGSILYDKNSNSYIPNTSGDDGNIVYTGSTEDDGSYFIKLKSLVPTDRSDYRFIDGELGDIFLNLFSLEEKDITDDTYEKNINSNYISTVSKKSHTNTGETNSLDFDAPLHINLELSSTFSEGINPVKVTFENKTNSDFELDKFKLIFTHENYLNFSEIDISNIEGFSISDSELLDGYGKVFEIEFDEIKTISANSDDIINIDIYADFYREDAGSIGLLSYIPYEVDNEIYGKITSYNTSLIGTTLINIYDIIIDTTETIGSLIAEVFTPSEGDSLEGGGISTDISEIAIAGLTVTESGDEGVINATGDNTNSISIDDGGIDKAKFKRDIKKAVEKVIGGFVAKTTNNDTNVTISSIGDKILYYDFSGQSCTEINGNNGCNLILGDGSSNLEIDGIHTIVVKGGNIHIKSNMYYKNNNSILGLVVLRAKEEYKKGGNIYIDPSITNVVGTIYSEGSVMSYKGNYINDVSFDRQLYIYGSLFTANTLGGSYGAISSNWECPYGSDYYVSKGEGNCTIEGEAQKYDLARLRNMVLVDGGGGTCNLSKGAKEYGTTTDEIVDNGLAGGNYGTTCINETDSSPLRNTTNNSSIVIEYNPKIQTLDLPGFTLK